MISPVIHFSGNCSEAISLYSRAFGYTDLNVIYYRDAPNNSDMNISEDMLDLVMHSTITLCGTKFNMSDVRDALFRGNTVCFNVFLSLEEERHNAYQVLSEEGEIIQDVGLQFFATLYTVIVDKFGIRWQIIVV